MTNRPAGRPERSRRKRADRLAAADSRRTPGRYARRRPRRLLAGAAGLTLSLLWADAAVSWALAPSDTAVIVNLAVLGVLVAAGFPLGGRLIALTGGVTSRRERELDERQLTARLRAFTSAHQATTAVMLAVIVATTIADRDGRESQIPGAALFLILFALFATHLVLPLVIATWQLPNPPADDTDEPLTV